MCEHSKQTVDRHVENNVHDECHDNRQREREAFRSRWACYNSLEWPVKRIADRVDELHERVSRPCGHQIQQQPQSERGVDQEENIIDHLGNTRGGAAAFDLVFRLNDLVDGLLPVIACQIVDLSYLSTSRNCSLGGYLAADLGFYCRLDILVGRGTFGLLHGKFFVGHNAPFVVIFWTQNKPNSGHRRRQSGISLITPGGSI